MGRHLRYAAGLAAGILVTRAAAGRDPALLSLSAEHFTETASVVEGPQAATISTESGYVERSGPMREVWHDEFLKTVIDHGTGQRAFQIDVSITYSGARRAYKGARYPGSPESETVPVKLLKTDSVNCAIGECTYTDQVAIPVEEEMLRHVAQNYVPGRPMLWTFRVIAKGAPDYKGSLSNAEIAGLLAKVDAYVQQPAATAAAAPVPPTRIEFGITGLAVSADPDLPNRAGVLVVGVTPGSIAQRAGIITGDIIYQFDTRSIRALPELEAAVAGSAAHPAVRIRLYRGKESTTLEVRF